MWRRPFSQSLVTESKSTFRFVGVYMGWEWTYCFRSSVEHQRPETWYCILSLSPSLNIHVRTHASEHVRTLYIGKGHLPHPLFMSITKLMPVSDSRPEFTGIHWHLNGDWLPTSLSKRFGVSDFGSDFLGWLKHSFETSIDMEEEVIDLANITCIRRAKTVQNSSSDRTMTIHVKDDILYNWRDEAGNLVPSYCTVEDILFVLVCDKAYLWILPNWYDHPTTGIYREKEKTRERERERERERTRT